MNKTATTAFVLMCLFMVTATGYSQEPLVYQTIDEAAEKGDLADVKRHIQRGEHTLQRHTVHDAIRGGHLDVVKYLVGKGAVVSVDAWICACAGVKARLDMVKFLVDDGVDVNIKNYHGRTGLMQAACGGHLDVVKYLMEQGADVNANDKDGMTPLMWAAHGSLGGDGHKDVVEFLVDNGADVNARDYKGRTLLDFVEFRVVGVEGWVYYKGEEQKDIREFFKQHGVKHTVAYIKGVGNVQRYNAALDPQ